ncbi:MAG: Trk system potassium transporter TrkA [Legionellaceae bacterium]|nr:Trk system potassium transporter TrkA [Legionellaceae bacterium]
MKIIILGGDQVGGILAENLVKEDHDITVVDLDRDKLKDLRQRLDIRTIQGFASYPNVMQEANAEDADLIIAATSNDEVNLVACQAAYSLFKIPTKIARVRAKEYLAYPHLFDDKDLPVDVFINSEQLMTKRIQRLLEHPGALQVLDFAKGKARILAIKPTDDSPLINKTIGDIYQLIKIELRVVAIFRGENAVSPEESAQIQAGDEVFFLMAGENTYKALSKLGRLDGPYEKIMISGNDRLSETLAEALEEKFQIKLITNDKKRAEHFADKLNNTTVLYGDPADRQLLSNENIEYTDVFCAMSSDDESNIMSCILAKQLGVRRTMCLIRHTTYIDLIEENNEIDIAISPQQTTISAILRYVRQGDMVNVYSLRRGSTEAIEIVAHGDEKTSQVVGKSIETLKLPKSATIGAIVRKDGVMIAKDDLVIESDDHVILFLTDKNDIHLIEKLFKADGVDTKKRK